MAKRKLHPEAALKAHSKGEAGRLNEGVSVLRPAAAPVEMTVQEFSAHHRASVSTTDVSTWRAGIDQ